MRNNHSSSTPARQSHGLIRLVLWTWQGCGYLEGYGYHPGSGFVAFLIVLGAAAGANSGWIGSLIGAGAMAATFGLLYLVGAYGRAKDFHSENTEVRDASPHATNNSEG